MEFDEFHKDLDCDCIHDAKQNCIDYFARRVKVSENGLKEKYFKSPNKYFTAAFVDCKKSCRERATSVDIWNEESKEHLTNQKIALGIAPDFRRKLIVFKIKQEGGLVKATPNNDNPFHHDLYWVDNFKVEDCFEVINTINITYHAI